MVKLLKNTPYGFVFELENNDPHFTEEYEIYINEELYRKTNKNVVSIFGLKPDTNYSFDIKNYKFEIKTLKPSFVINIKDYGATGDGVTNDSSKINAALYCALDGATIYIPKGTYLVDQIFLRSNIGIYIEKGATIVQNPNRAELAILKGYERDYDHTSADSNASWEGHPLDCYCSLIYGKNVENVHIYGDGEINGNGDISGFWDSPKIKNIAFRPRNITLNQCERITISGITSKNSACWNIHPYYCTNVSFFDLHIESIEESPNTDGLNPESCHNVEIIGCTFTVGDDCIAIKSGKYYMSKKHLRPTKNVVVRNCYMQKGHGAIVLGSEIACGVYDVKIMQCYFEGTDRGLRVKTRRGRGKDSIVDNISFDNVVMDGVTHCFVVNMFYFCDPDGKSDYVRNKNVTTMDEQTPTVKNIIVTNLIAKNIKGSAVFIYGLPENKVQNIVMKNNNIHFADQRINEVPAMMEDVEIIENLGVFITNGTNVIIENTNFEGTHNNIIEGVKQ